MRSNGNGNGQDDEHDEVLRVPGARPSQRETPVPPSDAVADSEVAAFRMILARVAELDNRIDDRLNMLERRIERALKDQEDKQARALASQGDVIAELSVAVINVERALGRPPTQIDLSRASQIGDLTADEIAKLESGTGLHGEVYRLHARDAKFAQAAGRAAGAEAAKTVSEKVSKSAANSAARRTGAIVGAGVVLLEAANQMELWRHLAALLGG